MKQTMQKSLENTQTTSVNETLREREKTHGNYVEVAVLSNALIEIAKEAWNPDIDIVHQETLHMIMIKIARIVRGDADFVDHWRDIAGYATLSINRIELVKKLKKLGLWEMIKRNPEATKEALIKLAEGPKQTTGTEYYKRMRKVFANMPKPRKASKKK